MEEEVEKQVEKGSNGEESIVVVATKGWEEEEEEEEKIDLKKSEHIISEGWHWV